MKTLNASQNIVAEYGLNLISLFIYLYLFILVDDMVLWFF